MHPRHEPLLSPPIAFAHRGASAHAPENTLAAFALALKLGATGLESDVWLTADGEPVLDHDGVAGLLRRRRFADLRRADLPEHVPTLAELYDLCGGEVDVSLDVKDPAAAPSVLAVAREAGAPLSRLWLCSPDLDLVSGWRELDDEVRLVDSTRLRRIKEGPERRAAALADAGVDTLNMHVSDWTGGLTTLLHRFGRLAFGWDAQHRRQLDELVRMGIDGVYSDHVDRMIDAIEGRPPSEPPTGV